jgi:hypothetical protein
VDETKTDISSPHKEDLAIKKQRSRARMRQKSGHLLSGSRSVNLLHLSPTAEEFTSEESAVTITTDTSNLDEPRRYDGSETLIPKPNSKKIRHRPGTPPPKMRSLINLKKQAEISKDVKMATIPIDGRKNYHTEKNPSNYHGKCNISMFHSSHSADNAPTPKAFYPYMKSPNLSGNTPEQVNLTTVLRTGNNEQEKFNKSTGVPTRRSAKSALPKPTPPTSSIRADRYTSRDSPSTISLADDMASRTQIGSVPRETVDAEAFEVQGAEQQEIRQALGPHNNLGGSQDFNYPPTAMAVDSKLSVKPPVALKGVSRDPLSRVSDEDDTKSLIARSPTVDLDKSTSTKRPANLQKKSVGSSEGNYSELSSKKNNKSTSTDVPIYANQSNSSLPRLTTLIRGQDRSSSTPTSSCKSTPADLQTPSKQVFDAQQSFLTDKRELSDTEMCPKNTLMSSGGSVRALTEKFNKPSPTKAGYTSLPCRTAQRKSISVDIMAPVTLNRAESLVAPYTTNSSPSKSQKSGQSERTPQSNRKLVAAALAVSGPTSPTRDNKRSLAKQSPPRRIVMSPVGDTKALRTTRKSYDTGDDKPDTFVVNSSNPYSNMLKPTDPAPVVTIKTMDGHRSKPSSIPSLGTILPAPEPPPVAQHVHFLRPPSGLANMADFVHPDSPFGDMFRASPPLSPGTSPPLLRSLGTPPVTRSNSVLHTQIRSLQKNMERKDNEIAKLRQQLITKGSLDIGPISEQLRESKRETQKWKTRAEVAEKQVEMFSTLHPGRVTSSRMSSEAAIGIFRTNTGYSDDGSQMRQQSKGGQGLDGAERTWKSDDSGDTVIHEVIEIEDVALQKAFDVWMSRSSG